MNDEIERERACRKTLREVGSTPNVTVHMVPKKAIMHDMYVFGRKVSLAVEMLTTEQGPWCVVYDQQEKHWWISNDLEALPSRVTATTFLGFADDPNGALFLIWEHQRSMGLTRTVLDDLKEVRRRASTRTH